MPTVPTYQRNQRTQALPGPQQRAPQNTGLQDVARAVGQIGDAMTDVAVKERNRADELAVLEATDRLNRTSNALLYDPESGALNTRGKNAFGLPDTTLGEYDKTAAEIERGLASDRQKEAFRKAAMRKRTSLDLTVQRHVAGEMRRYDEQLTESTLASSRETAALNYSDPELVAAEVMRQQDALARHADANGMPEEWLATKQLEAESGTHEAVLNRILEAGDDERAAAYLAANREGMTSKTAERMDKAVETATLRGRSQRQADALIAEHGEDMEGALTAAREIKDPEERDETLQRVRRYHSDLRAAQQSWKREALQEATNLVEESGSTDAIKPAVWSEFTMAERKALTNYAKLASQGVEPETDYAVWTRLMDQAANAPGKFKGEQLVKYRDKLANPEYEQLVKLQYKLRTDGQADELFNGYLTKKQVVDGALRAVNIDPTPKEGTDDAKAAAKFRRLVDQRISDLQQAQGSEASNEQVQQIVDDLLMEQAPDTGSVWGGVRDFFGSTDRRFELMAATPAEVPDEKRAEYADWFRREGIPVTPENIMRLYNREVLDGGE